LLFNPWIFRTRPALPQAPAGLVMGVFFWGVSVRV
jgi:hypothetical protein